MLKTCLDKAQEIAAASFDRVRMSGMQASLVVSQSNHEQNPFKSPWLLNRAGVVVFGTGL